MTDDRLFTFCYEVAEKPNRWVDDLTLIVEATDPTLGIDEIEERVTNYMTSGDNPAWLRELRGDILFKWHREGGTSPYSEPVSEKDGVKIFAPLRGVKMNSLG